MYYCCYCNMLLAPVGLGLKEWLMNFVLIFVSVLACVHSHISDVFGPILFIRAAKPPHHCIHKHIILFCDAIKDGRLTAILVVKKTLWRTCPQPFLRHGFADLIQTWQTENERWLTKACHFSLEIRSKMSDWRRF